MNKISVVKNAENPEKTEVLAEAIIRIGEAFEELQKNGLNEKAIVVLIHDETKIAKRDIQIVLKSLRLMRGWYCRQ